MTETDHTHDPVAAWNERYPVGTPVRYWPGAREGEGREGVTRSRAWTLGNGEPVVAVDDYPGGIHLTHVESDPSITLRVVDGRAVPVSRTETPRTDQTIHDPVAERLRKLDTYARHGMSLLPARDVGDLVDFTRAVLALCVPPRKPGASGDAQADAELLRRDQLGQGPLVSATRYSPDEDGSE